MKRILVIGGSYFAGRVLVEELRKSKDAEITVFNRGRVPLGLDGVRELRGDRDKAADIAGIPAEPWDAMVDFCGYTPEHVALMFDNLRGTVRHYVFVSTTTVYAKTSALPVAEEAPKLSGPQPDLREYADYGYDKWRAENVVMEACAQHGIAYTTLRPAIIYGYYNYAPRETYFFDALVRKEPIVIPKKSLTLFSFIWVVDMARLIIRCLEDERSHGQVFNLASAELVSYPRIIEVLAQITGKEPAVAERTAEEIEGARIAVPFPLREHLVYSGEKIRELFDFRYTELKDGMREALRHYLAIRRAHARMAD